MGGPSVMVSVLGNVRGLTDSLDTAEKKAGGFGDKLGGIGKIVGGALAGAGIVEFGRSAVAAFNESEQAQSKLDLALKNNAATVGVHADAFSKLNAELAKHTLADDDVIAATEAQIATFGASKSQIEGMIPTVLDLAAKMGVDGPEAADMFDKAALGSVKALKSLGIEGYKPTGDKANDLANIQGLLRDKVKGAAQAQLDAAGPGAKMKKSMDELQETVGKYLVPALLTVTDVATKVIDFFATHPAATLLAGAIGAVAAAVWIANTATALFGAEGAVATAASSAWAAAQWVLNAALDANPIGLIVVAIALLVGGLVVAYKNVGWFRDIVDTVFGWIGGFVTGAIDTVSNVITGVWNWIHDNWPLLLAILTGPIGLAVLAITSHWDTIKNAFTAVKDWIADRIGDIVGFFTGLPGRLAGAAGDVFRLIRDKMTEAKDWISDRIGDVVGFVTGLPGRISAATRGMFDGFINAFRGAINWIIERWNGLHFSIPGIHIGPVGFDGVDFGVPRIPLLAAGGPVAAGMPYIVGDAGPELFVPGQAGRIIPGGGGVVGAGGGNTYQIVVTAIDPRSAQEAVVNAIREYESRNGPGWRAS